MQGPQIAWGLWEDELAPGLGKWQGSDAKEQDATVFGVDCVRWMLMLNLYKLQV